MSRLADEAMYFGADWRQNSSLEIWFPFTAKELARWKRAAETNIQGPRNLSRGKHEHDN